MRPRSPYSVLLFLVLILQCSATYLIDLVDRKKWDALRERLRSHPEEAKVADQDGRVPFQLACNNNAPLDIIDEFLRIHPDAPHEKDDRGYLPLHWLLSNNDYGSPSLESVKLLIEANPEAIRTKNNYGQLPLHRATKTSPEIVSLLYELYPEAIYSRDSFGMTPLDVAFKWYRSPNLVGGLVLALLPGLQIAKETADTLDHTKADLESEKENTRLEFQRVGDELKDAKDRISSLESVVEKLMKNKVCVEEKLEGSEESNFDSTCAFESPTTNEEEANVNKDQLASKEGEIIRLRAELERTKDELKNTKIDLERAINELEATQLELGEVRAELEESISALGKAFAFIELFCT